MKEKEEKKEGERRKGERKGRAIRNVFGEATEGGRVFKAKDRNVINVSVFSILINAINELFSIWFGAQFRRTAGNRHLIAVYSCILNNQFPSQNPFPPVIGWPIASSPFRSPIIVQLR